MILFLLLSALGFAAFYVGRSSKQMPKNWRQFKSEILWQYLGVRGLIEDYYLRKYNRVDLYKQPGRIAVITGGNRGIGADVVEKLLQCEINVIMGVRNPKEAQKNIESRVDFSDLDGVKIHYEYLDTGNLKSVRQFAKSVQQKYSKIDILINNAGIMATPYYLTEDGFESQFAVNYLGHFLLAHLLMPQLRAAGTQDFNSRIINVSSCANILGDINMKDINGTKDYYPPDAYNQSKLAQVLFTRHLQLLINQDEDLHVQVHAVHPGVVDTDLFVHSSTTYVPWFKKLFFKNTEEGSRTIVYAAISPRIEGKGGSYLSNCVRVPVNSLAKNKKLREEFQFYL